MAKTTPSGRAKSKTKAPKKKPTQLDRIEKKLDTIHRTVVVRADSIHATLVDTKRSIGSIESKLSTLNAWEMLNEAMSNDKLASPTVAVEGLRDGDYTDASQEVADKLTAMGFSWLDQDRTKGPIVFWLESDRLLVNALSATAYGRKLTRSIFLSNAAVTAKALGLKPVEEKWVPKVGDYLVPIHLEGAYYGYVPDMKKMCGTVMVMEGRNTKEEGWFTVKENPFNWRDEWTRPATPEEIAAHEAKAEAQAAEDAKLVFGARVEVKGRENEIWKIGCDEPTDEGYWRLCPSKCGNLNTMTAKRHEFTLLP